MIPFKNRFHGHGSIRYVYNNGQVFRSRFIILKIVNNPRRKNTRVAVVISKKVLKSAIGRNRIRRRVYEYVRLRMPDIKGVFDIAIIISSSELLNMPHKELCEQLDRLFEQAQNYKP